MNQFYQNIYLKTALLLCVYGVAHAIPEEQDGGNF